MDAQFEGLIVKLAYSNRRNSIGSMCSLDFQHHIGEKFHEESGRYKSSNDKGIKISLKKIMYGGSCGLKHVFSSMN